MVYKWLLYGSYMVHDGISGGFHKFHKWATPKNGWFISWTIRSFEMEDESGNPYFRKKKQVGIVIWLVG